MSVRFCEYCGKELKENAKFCGFCGREVRDLNVVEATETTDFQAQRELEPEPGKTGLINRKRALIVVIVAAMILIVLFAVIAFKYSYSRKQSSAGTYQVSESTKNEAGDSENETEAQEDQTASEDQAASTETETPVSYESGAVDNGEGFSITFVRTGDDTATLTFENRSSSEYSIGNWAESRVELETSEGTVWAYFGATGDFVRSGETATYNLEFSQASGDWKTANVEGILLLDGKLPAKMTADGVIDEEIAISLQKNEQ